MSARDIDFGAKTPKQYLVDECAGLSATYLELGGADGVANQISLLPDFTLPGH
ncbi:hypothetical protein [Streptomyces sp. NPDC059063]|uniref:hypothetical protein n=1 Tax=unclassified Streptomyces TaxID=2593676 RepID=UPI0036982BE2